MRHHGQGYRAPRVDHRKRLAGRCAPRRWRGVVAIAGFSLAATAPGAQETPTFHATAELVRLQVAAFQKDGGPVLDLDRSDFAVLENGEERELSVFLPPDDGPLEVAIVMDTSGSMAQWDSRDVFHKLLDALHPDSCVLLLPFEERVARGEWGRPGDPRLRAIIDQIPQFGGSEAVYDALVAAFAILRGRRSDGPEAEQPSIGFDQVLGFQSPEYVVPVREKAAGDCVPRSAGAQSDGGRRGIRQAVVAVTDEDDSASATDLNDVILAAWGSGIPVFAVAWPELWSPGAPRILHTIGRRGGDPRAPIETLVKYTGGIQLRAKVRRWEDPVFRRQATISAYLDGVDRLGKALRAHYVLGFVPVREAGDEAGSTIESKIEVRVNRDDVEVFTTEQVIRGQAMSEGAALDVALRGFRQGQANDAEVALATFDAAVALGPQLGLAHYGRALALTGLSRHEEGLAAFEQARELAPWLPDLDIRMAVSALQVGRFDEAWEHALRAHGGGAELGTLVEQLQEVAPRDVDLSTPPPLPRVAVQIARGGDLLARSASPVVFAAVMNLLARSEVMVGSEDSSASDLMLTVRVNAGTFNGPWLSVRGRLTLEDHDGHTWASESFGIHDVDNRRERLEELGLTFAKIEAAVQEFRRPDG